MKKNAARMGSNQIVANAMAERVLNHLKNGKSEHVIKKDLEKTKQAFELAKKAYFDKDPEAINFLQLDEGHQSEKEVIMLSDDLGNNSAQNIQL